MGKALLSLAAVLIAAGAAEGYDPLYYNTLAEVLGVTRASGDFGLGFFTAGSYWETDTTGRDSLYEFSEALSVIRLSVAGQYGLTSSHTIGIILPIFFQLQGPGDSTGIGIADPWITFDGWIERSPQLVGRGALRIPFKGALESGDYSESDPHLALDGSLTMTTPISGSSGPKLRITGGLRYYFWAWDGVPGTARDSADTRPPMEIHGIGTVILPVNPELTVHLGLEMATRGETSIRQESGTEGVNGSSFRRYDLRGGFELDNSSISLTADVWYRLGGENTPKEWGIMVSGIGLGLDDIFGTSGGGSR
jgi:hypothetical protein